MDRLIEKTYLLLKEQGKTLSIAESCTGGLLCKLFTDKSGCSDVFLGGVVSYANEVKMDSLGVPQSCLDTHGAVSAETAAFMAKGVQKALGSTIGIATTGIAGPDGGSKEKPVGLVYITIADKTHCITEKNIFIDTRDRVRTLTAKRAYELLEVFLKTE